MLQTLEWKCKIFAPTENLSKAVFNMQTISLILYSLILIKIYPLVVLVSAWICVTINTQKYSTCLLHDKSNSFELLLSVTDFKS